MAFFKADVPKFDILITAGSFVIGLLCIVLAQACAFFTMAKRSEAQEEFRWEQFNRVHALMYPYQHPTNIANLAESDKHRSEGNRRLRLSDVWRRIGLCLFGISLLAFVGGCGWGAKAVVAAKDKLETSKNESIGTGLNRP
jgi:hypothetical protein